MKLEASVRFLNDCIVRHRQLSTQVRQHLLQRGEQAWEVIPNRISQHFMIHPIIAMRHDVPQPGSTPWEPRRIFATTPLTQTPLAPRRIAAAKQAMTNLLLGGLAGRWGNSTLALALGYSLAIVPQLLLCCAVGLLAWGLRRLLLVTT